MARHKRQRRTGPAMALAAGGALVGAVLVGALVVVGTSGPGKEHTTRAGAEGERVASAPPSGVSSSSSPQTSPPASPSASSTGAPSAPPTAPPTARAALEPVLDPVPGTGAPVGRGPLSTYSVEVQRGLPVDATAFAAAVERTLSDRRSWTANGTVSLQRVPPQQAHFRVALASPALVDELCRPLDTAGIYSCFNGTRAMINSMRWERGADAFGADLPGYRTYLINHEVGHALDHRHERCPAVGALAPVMVQQTIGTQGCRPNPWPFPAPSRLSRQPRAAGDSSHAEPAPGGLVIPGSPCLRGRAIAGFDLLRRTGRLLRACSAEVYWRTPSGSEPSHGSGLLPLTCRRRPSGPSQRRPE